MNHDKLVTVSLGTKHTDTAAAALKIAAKEYEADGHTHQAGDARQYAAALSAASDAFDSFTADMEVRDAVGIRNMVCKGGRNGYSDAFLTDCYEVVDEIDEVLDK